MRTLLPAERVSETIDSELDASGTEGFMNFDYCLANCSFAWNYDVKAQYCWALLIRDVRFSVKHPDNMSEGHFRFVFAVGWEHTNNHSKQQSRHVVIERCIPQDARGQSGQRYREHMWTAIST